MAKLPVHGGPGPRTGRFHSEYEHPFQSRAQRAKPMYDDVPRGGMQHPGPPQPAAPSAAPGQNPAGGSTGVGSSASGAPAAPPPGQYDLSADPVLQQVQATIERANADAAASALRGREQALLDYGDPALASSVLVAKLKQAQLLGGDA